MAISSFIEDRKKKRGEGKDEDTCKNMTYQ